MRVRAPGGKLRAAPARPRAVRAARHPAPAAAAARAAARPPPGPPPRPARCADRRTGCPRVRAFLAPASSRTMSSGPIRRVEEAVVEIPAACTCQPAPRRASAIPAARTCPRAGAPASGRGSARGRSVPSSPCPHRAAAVAAACLIATANASKAGPRNCAARSRSAARRPSSGSARAAPASSREIEGTMRRHQPVGRLDQGGAGRRRRPACRRTGFPRQRGRSLRPAPGRR